MKKGRNVWSGFFSSAFDIKKAGYIFTVCNGEEILSI